MDAREIESRFIKSTDRAQAIHDLAKMSESDEETIIEVLKDKGICVKVARCQKCGRAFPMYLSPFCYTCEGVVKQRRELGKLNDAIIEYQIKKNATKKHELIMEIIRLDLELARLKEELHE